MLPSLQPGDDPITSLEVAKTVSGYKQSNQTETPKLTPSQQRKKGALDMAELIYNIYNKDCPATLKGSDVKENENV